MTALRVGWTNLILHTTGYIYRQKQNLLTASAANAILNVIGLALAEIFLVIISLPLYLAAKNIGKDREDAVAEYKVRRVMTLSILSAILIIWAIKLGIILLLSFQGQAAFQIRETKTQSQNIPQVTIEIPKAAENPNLQIPVIKNIDTGRGSISITGTAKPDDQVVATIAELDNSADSNPMLYAGQTDARGNFTITEDEATFYLPKTKYAASIVAYDSATKSKSAPSQAVSFAIADPLWRSALNITDQILNILAITFILLGLLVMVLTL